MGPKLYIEDGTLRCMPNDFTKVLTTSILTTHTRKCSRPRKGTKV